MSLGDFEILNKLGNPLLYFNAPPLGSGAYSTVYKVKRLTDSQLYAMKKVDIGDLTFKEK
jgi:NIMA (never in mitosis gene a)-related kinase